MKVFTMLIILVVFMMGCSTTKPLNLAYTLDNVSVCGNKQFSPSGNVSYLTPGKSANIASFSFKCEPINSNLKLSSITLSAFAPNNRLLGIVVVRFRDPAEDDSQELLDTLLGHARLLDADVFVPDNDHDLVSQGLKVYKAYRNS